MRSLALSLSPSLSSQLPDAVEQLDALRRRQIVDVVLEDLAERRQRLLPLLALVVPRRAPALRLEVRLVELGRARVRLAHLVVEPERVRRVRQAHQPLDLHAPARASLRVSISSTGTRSA